MDKYGIQIFRKNSLNIPLNRKNDRNIMRMIIDAGVGVTECKLINICRQYLKVINLSDITNAAGNKIIPEYFHRQVHSSQLNWPHYEKPPQKVWVIWRKYIQQIVCENRNSNTLKEEYKMGQ